MPLIMGENEKNYYKNIYSKFWKSQVKKYGLSKYEQKIINLILGVKPKEVFEVAIGTGWPIAEYLYKEGIKINGCDISPKLINGKDGAKVKFPDGNIYVGDALDIRGEGEFDVIYCVRSSWYIENFISTIANMLKHINRKRTSYLVFDIMDKRSLYYAKICVYYLIRKLKSFLVFKDYVPVTYFYSVKKINSFLKDNNISWKMWPENKITESKDKWNTPKRLYICKVEAEKNRKEELKD